MPKFSLAVWVTRNFPRGFTSVVKGSFVDPQAATQGATDLFCYDRNSGVGAFYATVRNGRLNDGTPVVDGPHKVGINHTFANRWTHMVFVPPLLLFSYDAFSGVGQFDQIDGRGDMFLKKKHTGLRTTWTKIIAGRFGRANMFFYDAPNGAGEFYSVNSAGDLRLIRSFTGFRTSWHAIVNGNFSNSPNDDLLFYDKGAGVGEFYKVDDNAGIRLFSQHTNWRNSWAHVISGRFLQNAPFDGLLFYEGEGSFHTEFYSTDGRGNISQLDIAFGSEWRLPWRDILAGEFTPNIGIVGTSRLCNYDTRDGVIRYFFLKPRT